MKTRSLASYTYVLEEDRDLPEAEQTIHEFRQLTHSEDVQMQAIVEAGRTADAMQSALLASYIGCRGLMDEEGNPVEVSTQQRSPLGKPVRTVSDRILNMMTREQRMELAAVASGAKDITEEDAKN
jgi:hypothetical protein